MFCLVIVTACDFVITAAPGTPSYPPPPASLRQSAALATRGHFGMVFIPGGYRRTKADTGRIITAFEAILARHPGDRDLANGETWL